MSTTPFTQSQEAGVLPLSAWLRLIEQYSGMVLPEQLHEHFLHRIADMAAHYAHTQAAFFVLVNKDSQIRQSFIEHVLINESRFFRDTLAIEFVAESVKTLDKVVTIWSAGCSSGEEVWSLAMHIATKRQIPCKIVATDISNKVINRAIKRQYSISKLVQIPLQYRDVYVKNVTDVSFEIQPDSSWLVDFLPFNLLEANYPYRNLDVIFCQNVLIYFRQFERVDILNRMVPCLRLGGVLVLGSGEVQWGHPDMQRVDTKGILAYARTR